MKKHLILIPLICVIAHFSYATTRKVLKADTFLSSNKSDEGTKMKLILGDKTYDIQSYNLSYFPASGNKTMTETVVNTYQSSVITIGVRSSKIDQEFIDWLLKSDAQPKDGQIIIYDADTKKTLRTISFTGASTWSYNEYNNVQNFTVSNQVTSFSIKYKTINVKIQ